MEKHWALFWKWAFKNTQALLKLPTFLYCFMESEKENEVWLSCSEESAEKEKFLVFSPWKCLCFLTRCRRGGLANRGIQHLFGTNNGKRVLSKVTSSSVLCTYSQGKKFKSIFITLMGEEIFAHICSYGFQKNLYALWNWAQIKFLCLGEFMQMSSFLACFYGFLVTC